MKKLFSIIAAFMMVSTMLPMTSFGASYSDELTGAYDYAYGMGITTMSSIDNANIYGSLTRVALAKMVANYVLELGLQTPDTTKACEFIDVSDALDAQYGNGVTNACQLGLMGVGITTFRPNDVVTRAEFGTVLSRAIWGDMYNGATPYYTNHLNALKDAGVMNNISNPNASEVRGYVMLMMQRADENGVANDTPAICSTPENILACSLGLDSCPAECLDTEEEEEEEVEVKDGTLTVSLGSSLADNSEIPSVGIVKLSSVKFKASSADVNLKTIEIEKLGLASVQAGTKVWFERDGVRITGKSSFTAEGSSIISFAPVYTVKAGNTETLDLYAELNYTANTNVQFTSVDFDTTAEDVNGSFTTPVLRTANYTVAPSVFDYVAGGTVSNITDNGVELGAFTIKNNDTSADTRDLKLKSIALRQNGNADLVNLGDVVLERNGEVVSTDVMINGRDLTFSVSDIIEDGVTATYYIKAVVNNVETAQDNYQFQVRYTTDINIEEASTSFRSTVSFDLSDSDGDLSDGFDLDTYGIEGGDVTFARDTDYALSANASAGSEVTLMKGTVTTKESITFEDPTLTLNSLTTGSLADLFSVVYLKVGSATFSYVPTTGDVAGSGIQFLGSVTVDGNATVKLYGTLKSTANTNTVKFSDLRLTNFARAEYVSNGYTADTAVGSIPAISLTVEDTALNITRIDGLGDTTIAAGATDMPIYEINLSSTQGNGVKVNRATFDITSSGTGYLNNVYLTLYVDGTAVSTKTAQTGTVVFDGFNKTINADNTVTMKVVATFAEAFDAGDFQLSLNALNAYDALTSEAIVGYTLPAGASFTIGSASATLAMSSSNPGSQLLLAASQKAQLVALKVLATNDSVKLNDVSISGTGLAKLSNYRLTNVDGTVFATATSASTGTVTFTNTTSAPTIEKDQSSTFFVVADVNSNTTGSVDLIVNMTGTNIKSSNGTVIAVGGSAVTANTQAIVENGLMVAKLDNLSKAVASSALKFSITAKGKNSIDLTSLSFSNALSQYDLTSATLEVIDSNNNVVATGAAGAASVNFIAPYNTVDAGTTTNYTVRFPGAVLSASNTDSWSVSLSDIVFVDGATSYNAANYNSASVGTFPVTESK